VGVKNIGLVLKNSKKTGGRFFMVDLSLLWYLVVGSLLIIVKLSQSLF